MMQRWYRIFLGVFLALVVGSWALLALKGIPLGIDFTGGTSLTVRVATATAPPEVEERIREFLEEKGFRGEEVRAHGEGRVEILWQEAPEAYRESAAAVVGDLSKWLGVELSLERLAQVGPVLGAELRRKALWAVGAVFLIILGYLAFAFRGVGVPVSSWWYGIAALAALVHDVTIPVAVVTLAAHAFGVTVDLLFVTAILAIVGYSVNDTIVVFDRIRERLAQLGEEAQRVPFARVVDEALRASLMRSINTSLTTTLALVALVGWGAESTRWFALTLLIGVVAGTLSSLLFAPAILVAVAEWKQSRKKEV